MFIYRTDHIQQRELTLRVPEFPAGPLGYWRPRPKPT